MLDNLRELNIKELNKINIFIILDRSETNRNVM